MRKENEIHLSEDLVAVGMTASDQFAALDTLGHLLYEKGYVKESYLSAIREREKLYPTGLPTDGAGVAIPHTDAEHVLVPAVAIGTLKQPVSFRMMGNPAEEVAVDLIFMLAVKEPKMQIATLQRLMAIFQQRELLLALKTGAGPGAVISLAKHALEE